MLAVEAEHKTLSESSVRLFVRSRRSSLALLSSSGIAVIVVKSFSSRLGSRFLSLGIAVLLVVSVLANFVVKSSLSRSRHRGCLVFVVAGLRCLAGLWLKHTGRSVRAQVWPHTLSTGSRRTSCRRLPDIFAAGTQLSRSFRSSAHQPQLRAGIVVGVVRVLVYSSCSWNSSARVVIVNVVLTVSPLPESWYGLTWPYVIAAGTQLSSSCRSASAHQPLLEGWKRHERCWSCPQLCVAGSPRLHGIVIIKGVVVAPIVVLVRRRRHLSVVVHCP